VRQLGDALAHVAVRLGSSRWTASAIARQAHQRTRPLIADRTLLQHLAHRPSLDR
jgi:hypothetical protein